MIGICDQGPSPALTRNFILTHNTNSRSTPTNEIDHIRIIHPLSSCMALSFAVSRERKDRALVICFNFSIGYHSLTFASILHHP